MNKIAMFIFAILNEHSFDRIYNSFHHNLLILALRHLLTMEMDVLFCAIIRCLYRIAYDAPRYIGQEQLRMR